MSARPLVREAVAVVLALLSVAAFATGFAQAWLERSPPVETMLRSGLVSHRLYALRWMDRDQLRAELPQLVRMVAADPDPRVREEVIRQLGYTGDPSVQLLLHEQVFGEHPEAALESLGYLGTPEACGHLLEATWHPRLRHAAVSTLYGSGWRCLDHLTLQTDEERQQACPSVLAKTYPALERFASRSGCPTG